MNLQEIQQYLLQKECPLKNSDIETSLVLFQKFGYSFQSILSHGCFGIVVLAIKKDINERVAIKISVNEGYAKSELEIKFCKKCNNISYFSKYYEHFYNQSKQLCYIVQQYCEKGNLKHYLESNPLLTEYEKIKLFIQILKGIDALHEFGIIYADLTPENILISDENNALLSNFSASRLKNQSQLLASDSIRTMVYCPPEQVEFKIVPQSDFYSAGVVLFHLLGDINVFQFFQMKMGVFPNRNQYQNKDLYDIAKSLMAIDPLSRSTPEEIIPKLRSIMIAQNAKQNTLTSILDDQGSLNTQSQMSNEISSNEGVNQIPNNEKTVQITQKSYVHEEIIQNYPNGQIKMKGWFKNGKPHGQVIRYYENGKQLDNGYYKDGLEDGEGKEYYQNGNLKQCRQYKKGKYHGQVIRYYENGKELDNGQYKDGLKDGIVREYYLNGNLRLFGNYVKGKFHGQLFKFYENGNFLEKGIYQNGLKDSLGNEYYENRNLKKSGLFKDGKYCGQVIQYFENGNIQINGQYDKGKEHGEVREYFENGNLKSCCLYLMGIKHGKFEEYNINGQIIKQECYEKGLEQGKICNYDDGGKKKSQSLYEKAS